LTPEEFVGMVARMELTSEMPDHQPVEAEEALDRLIALARERSQRQTKETQRQDAIYRALAWEEWHRDGEVEVDDNAVVSVSDDGGAYVQAWVWVYDPEDEATVVICTDCNDVKGCPLAPMETSARCQQHGHNYEAVKREKESGDGD
jgi:hypothetical protein